MSSDLSGFLNKADFMSLIRNGPLVSLDILITNSEGNFLFGKRKNSPAKGSFFFPGGRLWKGEMIKDAIDRILKGEIRLKNSIQEFIFLGFFEHHYQDSFFWEDDSNLSTHYIALTFKIEINQSWEEIDLSEQHSEKIWLSLEGALQNEEVHPYCKECLGLIANNALFPFVRKYEFE